ncbi:MAG: SCP2 sterol-binding domain-containing protein [Methanomassiliicoccales archaeon]
MIDIPNENEEKLRFPSVEWFNRYAEEINKNKEYEASATRWEGDFLYVILPDEEFDREEVYYLDLYHGKCRACYRVENREVMKTQYMMLAKYGVWMKIGSGELDPVKAILTGKLKVKGNLAQIMRYKTAATELAKTASRVPTIR